MRPEEELLAVCACHNVRMAARALTRAYDEALRPSGLRATQAAVLAAIAVEGSTSIAALAEQIGMDRTTLTRNIRPLARDKLIAIGSEGYRRGRTLSVTPRGRARLEEAMPLWRAAQRRVEEQLGERWPAARRIVDELSRAG